MTEKVIKRNGVVYLPEWYSLGKLAERNRNHFTKAENEFNNWLKRKGFTFKTQVPIYCGINNYIADFVLYPKKGGKVVVEIDGGYHNTEAQKRKDSIRTDNIKKMGYRVVRLTNEEVKKHRYSRVAYFK